MGRHCTSLCVFTLPLLIKTSFPAPLLLSVYIMLFCPLMFSGLINNFFFLHNTSHKFLFLSHWAHLSLFPDPIYWDWGGCCCPMAPNCGVTEGEAVNQDEGKTGPPYSVCPPLLICLPFTSVQHRMARDDGGERVLSCWGKILNKRNWRKCDKKRLWRSLLEQHGETLVWMSHLKGHKERWME